MRREDKTAYERMFGFIDDELATTEGKHTRTTLMTTRATMMEGGRSEGDWPPAPPGTKRDETDGLHGKLAKQWGGNTYLRPRSDDLLSAFATDVVECQIPLPLPLCR